MKSEILVGLSSLLTGLILGAVVIWNYSVGCSTEPPGIFRFRLGDGQVHTLMVQGSSVYFGQRILHQTGVNTIDLMTIELQDGITPQKKKSPTLSAPVEERARRD